MSKQKQVNNTKNTSAVSNATTTKTGFLEGIWENSRSQQIVLFAVAFLLYANTLLHQFTLDDAIVITDNMFTQKGISGIGGILSYDTFYGFFKESGKANLVAGGRYRPASLVVFAMEYQIFGSVAFWFHLVNVMLYAFLCVSVYRFILALLEDKKIAFLGALLFTLHPIHTEVVANVKGLDEILSLLGCIWAVLFLLREGNKNLIFAFLCYFGALMSKENAAMWIFIVPLIFYFFRPNTNSIILKIAPILTGLLLFLGIRSMVIGSQFGGEQLELMNNPFLKWENGQYIAFSFSEKIATIFYTLGKYLVLILAPFQLSHDYYPRAVEIMTFGNVGVIASILAYFGLGFLAFKGFQEKKIYGFGVLFFLLTLFIVSNIPFAVGTNMAERFLFMPTLGVAMIAGYYLSKAQKSLFLPIFAIFALFFAFKTVTRNTVWRDNYTLFTTDAQTVVNSAKVQCAAGGAIIDSFKIHSDSLEQLTQMAKAIEHLALATKIHPAYKQAFLLQGNAYFYRNEFPKAVESYKQALKIDSTFRDAETNLQKAYCIGGEYYGKTKGDLQRAVEYLSQAYILNPKDFRTVLSLGIACGIGKLNTAAVDYFEQAVALQPNNAEAVFYLGNAYSNIGNLENGEAFRQRAMQLNPNMR